PIWQRGGDRAEAQAAYEPVPEGAHLLVQALHIAKDPACPHQDPLALRRESLESLAALHDEDAELLLQVLDAGGERGLGHLARGRRAREMPLDRQRQEVAKVSCEHG